MGEPAAGQATALEAAVRRRVFFALWPEPTTRRALARATRAAVRHSGGRPTPTENLHITLAFLGPIAAVDLSKVLALAAPPGLPFELVLDRLGLWERAQVLWIAPAATPAPLLELQRCLWDQLVDVGFERERRPYLPHVTVARKAQAARGTVTPVHWPVTGIALVESKTAPRNARYDVLKTWDFAAAG